MTKQIDPLQDSEEMLRAARSMVRRRELGNQNVERNAAKRRRRSLRGKGRKRKRSAGKDGA